MKQIEDWTDEELKDRIDESLTRVECCLCGEIIVPDENGWAERNNAEPLGDGRCCNKCNEVVIMKRLQNLRRNKNDR